MGRTKKIKKEDRDEGVYSMHPKPSSGDYKMNEEKAEPDLSNALLELDPTNKPAESRLESAPEIPADIKIDSIESVPQQKTNEILTARVELIKSIATAHDRLKEIDDIRGLRTEVQKSKIEKVFKELEKISVGLKEAENLPVKEMEKRIEQYNKRIEKFNNRISSLKKEIKEMVDKLIEEGKEPAKKFVESATVDGYTVKIGQEVKALRSSGDLDAGWVIESIDGDTVTLDKRTSKKGGLKKYDVLISDLKKWNEQLEIVEPVTKERVIIENEDDIKIGQILRLKRTSGEMDDGWKVDLILDKQVALQKKAPDGTLNKVVLLSELVEWNGTDIPQQKTAPDVSPDTDDKLIKETPVEEILSSPETIMSIPETMENPPEDIFELKNTGEIKEQYELIQKLSLRLSEARNKLKEAFVKKEKASGIVGKFKKMFGSKDSESANQEYETAWNEYANLQKEMIEASQAQAGNLREFLNQESSDLQAKIGEYYKGKENIISKVWRRLGEMNLSNYLEKKAVAVKAMEEQGEEIGRWDRFWANRAEELKQSNKLYKIGAKVLSVRLGLSMGLLGGGIFGIPGVAEARGAFVGLGSAMGSRHLEDAAQNKIQRWLGNRGEFYSSSEEAQKIMAEKFGIVEKTMDEGVGPDEPEDKKMTRRRAKFEKMLGKAEKDLLDFEGLSVADRLEQIQERISSIEAYAYVNGLDLSQDASYRQLILARDKNTEQFLAEKAVEIGDERAVIRPDSLEDAMAFLDSRKKELTRTAEKVAGEKKLRWAKRLVSVAVGAVSGTYAYLATLSRAELFNGGGSTAEATPAPIAPVVEAENPAPVSGIGEFETGENIVMEDELVPMNSEDLSAVKNFVTVADGNEKAMEFFNKAITEGHSPKEIYESLMVHKGDGMERILQRQLIANPEKFGFQGNLEDAQEIKRWAGREASLIAQKQGIADKYFIYNENKPQFLILNEDKSVDSLGRLHHVSEILKAKAVEVARLAEDSAEQVSPPSSEDGVFEVRQVIDAMAGGPKMMTNAEQIEFDNLLNGGQYDEAMDYMLEHRARGPIFELSDGTQVHRADISGWEGNAPDIELSNGARVSFSPDMQNAFSETPLNSPDADNAFNSKFASKDISDPAVKAEIREHVSNASVERIQALEQALEQTNPNSPDHQAIIRSLKMQLDDFNIRTGQDPSEFFHKDFIDKINSESVASKPMVDFEANEPPDQEEITTQIFESAPLNSVDTRYGELKFDYDNGQPTAFDLPEIPRDAQKSLVSVLASSETGEVTASSLSSNLDVVHCELVDAYNKIYIDMQNQGLQNTAEARFMKDKIRELAATISESNSKSPEELFNDDIVNRYNLKNN